MKTKFTHVRCVNEVVEDDIVLFKKGETYKIVGFDYRSLVYYVEPEFYEDNPLPDEFAIAPLHPNFQFLIRRESEDENI